MLRMARCAAIRGSQCRDLAKRELRAQRHELREGLEAYEKLVKLTSFVAQRAHSFADLSAEAVNVADTCLRSSAIAMPGNPSH